MNDTPSVRLPLGDPDAGFPTMDRLEFLTLRELCGSQEEVARDMETARRTIGRWERGDRAIPGCAAVCIRLLAEKARERQRITAAAVADMTGGKVS